MDGSTSPGSAPADPPGRDAAAIDRIRRLTDRVARERRARREAERLLESKSLALYEANRALAGLAADLEQRVAERTHELSMERQRAVAMAEVDGLTGIANRASFARHLGEALALARETGDGIATLLIDLDDFKTVNDTLGHAAGDALLVDFASRLVVAIRPGDVVARLGGDEFAVIARDVGSGAGALTMAHRLLRTLCRPTLIDGRSVPSTCSIGIAESAVAKDPEELLRDADLALYESKRTGRAKVTLFQSDLRNDLERRGALDRRVREAVSGDRIEPWFQPIRDCATGRFVGAEVLARWHDEDGTVRAPVEFLDTVEELGLLDAMMENMLARAFREALPAIASGSLQYLSINVSPTQFNQGWAVERLPALLRQTGYPDRALVIEITENALLHDIRTTRVMLATLTAIGIRIAVDDFGVGYSNFSLLRQLPFDMLKLDRTLVCDIEHDRHARALAEGMLDLAARLDLKVVAEGVETRGQMALLEAAGCDGMQGFHLARPHRDLGSWFASGPPVRGD